MVKRGMRDEKTLRGHVDAFSEPMSPGPDEVPVRAGHETVGGNQREHLMIFGG